MSLILTAYSCYRHFLVESAGGAIGPVDSSGPGASLTPWNCITLLLSSSAFLWSFFLLTGLFFSKPRCRPAFLSPLSPRILLFFARFSQIFSLFLSTSIHLPPPKKTNLFETSHCFLGLGNKEVGLNERVRGVIGPILTRSGFLQSPLRSQGCTLYTCVCDGMHSDMRAVLWRG